MTTIVSFSDFRKNLSDYIQFIKEGNEVVIEDSKKKKNLVTLTAKKEEDFDWGAHLRWMKNFKPVFNDEDVSAIKRVRAKEKTRVRSLNW